MSTRPLFHSDFDLQTVCTVQWYWWHRDFCPWSRALKDYVPVYFVPRLIAVLRCKNEVLSLVGSSGGIGYGHSCVLDIFEKIDSLHELNWLWKSYSITAIAWTIIASDLWYFNQINGSSRSYTGQIKVFYFSESESEFWRDLNRPKTSFYRYKIDRYSE